jgi:hypothetical protein
LDPYNIQKFRIAFMGMLVIGAVFINYTLIDNSLKIEKAFGAVSNDTRLSGNLSATLDLSNGTTLSVHKTLPVVECAPGSVWDELFGC